MKRILATITVLSILLSTSVFAGDACAAAKADGKKASDKAKETGNKVCDEAKEACAAVKGKDAPCVVPALEPEVAKEEKAPASQQDTISYCIGLDMGSRFKEMDVALTPEMILKGINDGLSGAEPSMSEEEMQAAMLAFQKEMMAKQREMMAKQQEEMKKQGEKNKEEGEKFLAENKEKEGVKTTDSGLQYIILEEGEGEAPSAGDTVKVHYKGTLLDGTVFDSSYDRGQPATFPLNGVIKGWTEGLQLIKKGGKAKLFIPSDLAYGPRGAGKDIGPDATLIFEVELLDIEPAPEAAKDAAKPKADWAK